MGSYLRVMEKTVAEKSDQDVKQEVEELLREIELQREAAQQQGLSFIETGRLLYPRG